MSADEPARRQSAQQVDPPADAPPRRPRPARPRQLRPRRVVLAPVAGGEPVAVSVPALAAQFELAGEGPLRAAILGPPKRPAYLPSRAHHPGAATSLQTSLGAVASAPLGGKPNRYSLAQLQQWQQAAADSLGRREASAAQQQAQQAPRTSPGGGGGGFHYHFGSPFASAASRVLVVNPIVNLSEHTKSRLVKTIEAVKRFSEKWFSHVLLLLFLAAYACLGAYVFISFEAPTEQWEKQLIIDSRLRVVNDSFEAAHAAASRDQFAEQLQRKLEDYERLLNRACASGMTSSSLENQWTFWGALFYSMTVFTTIGYGHLTPVTFAGRVATMVYAIFGIPILLMVLADLGKLLTKVIKFAFKRFRWLYNKLARRKESVRTRKLISDNTHQYIGLARGALERGLVNYIQPCRRRLPGAFRCARRPSAGGGQGEPPGDAIPSGGASEPPDRSRAPAVESSDVIVTPGGQTKPVSPQPEAHGRRSLLASFGAGGSANQHQATHQKARRKISTSSKIEKRRPATAAAAAAAAATQQPISRSSSSSLVNSDGKPAGKAPPSKRSLSADETSDQNRPADGDGELTPAAAAEARQQQMPVEEPATSEFPADELDQDDFDIPVSFALFLLITYMMFGAVVFSIWEGWNFFDALYFVFISMSTIGFGDLVPQHPRRMVGTFAYLLFGLALTSMCINVVQEKIHATFLRAKMQIGEKMGFDLEQIMADDYYNDTGSAYDDHDEYQEDAHEEFDANSVAVSQTNSSLANEHEGGPRPSEPLAPPATSQPSSLRLAWGASKRKWSRKRGSDGAGGSFKRKSSKKQPAGRQPGGGNGNGEAPPAKPQQPVANSGSNQPLAQACQQQLPIRSQLHVVNWPVVQQPPAEADKQQVIAINQPVDSLLATCEPLRRGRPADASAAEEGRARPASQSPRPKLISTRSHPIPEATRASFDSSAASAALFFKQIEQRHPQQYSQAGAASGPLETAQSARRPQLSRTPQPWSKVANRSLGSTRRSSVSHELSQLDDIIVALSRTPSMSSKEKFGPLLGIPATKQRPNSSNGTSSSANLNNALANSNQSIANNNNSHGRRATSMMNRSANSSPRPQVQKKRSLAGQSSLHLRPAPANHLVLSHSARQPLNLSESQAALAELEAIKFSAI